MGRQLASFDDITYTYDESGIRTSKTSNGVTTKYYLNGTNIIEQTDSTNTLHFYYDSSSELIGFNYADNDYFYVKNQKGDITDIVDADGNVVASYAYDPWGAVISVSGSNLDLANLNPFRYRSYYYDTDIQMYYLQSRYYDANVCRFINCDSVSFIGLTETEVSYNPFAYCENEPVNYSDPSGEISINTICISFANIIKWLFKRNDDLGRRIKNRYKTSKFGKSPLTLKVSGNEIKISVTFRFVGSLKDVRYENQPYNKTYKSLFLDAIEQYWSGTFDVYGYKATLSTTVKESDNSGINVHMLDSYGVSQAIISGGWHIGNYGYIVMYRGDSRSDERSYYNFAGFRYVAAHEFGHILGVDDIHNKGYKKKIDSIYNEFGSPVHNCDVEMVLMAFLFNYCITYEYYLNNRSQVI